MSEEVQVPEQLSIMNTCFDCLKADERCTNCQEDFDNSQTILAHTIVDEGNEVYRRQWLRDTQTVSGHDWTDRADEFLPPIVHMADRIFDEDEDLDVPAHQVICPWCKLQTTVAPNCNICDKEINA